MTKSRQSILTRKQALIAATCAVGALSTQVLACDPMVPPAREPVPDTSADAGPTAPPVAVDAGHD